jgi:hypothetical protein
MIPDDEFIFLLLLWSCIISYSSVFFFTAHLEAQICCAMMVFRPPDRVELLECILGFLLVFLF